MADGFRVNPIALRMASTTWDDQSEVLRGGKKRLLDAEDAVADLGPRVGPAATTWISTWLDVVQGLVDAADDHSRALDDAASDYTTQDQTIGSDLAQLLPWGQHDGAPTPGYTSPPGYQGYRGNWGGPSERRGHPGPARRRPRVRAQGRGPQLRDRRPRGRRRRVGRRRRHARQRRPRGLEG